MRRRLLVPATLTLFCVCAAWLPASAWALVTPTLTTTTSGSVHFGDPLHDTAHLAGGASPTGTITFKLYGPSGSAPGDVFCSNPPVATLTTAVSDNGDYASTDFTPSIGGHYRWIASYGGDSNNNPVSSVCNAANASVEVVNDPGIGIAPGSFTAMAYQDTPSHNSTVPDTRAGAHPDMQFSMRLCYPTSGTGDTPRCPSVPGTYAGVGGTGGSLTTDDFKAFTLHLPPGLLGDVRDVPTCSQAQYLANTCPDSARVGSTVIAAVAPTLGGETPITGQTGAIYNLATQGDEPARLGTLIWPADCGGGGPGSDSGGTGSFAVRIPSTIRVRTAGDLGIDSIQDSNYDGRDNFALADGLPTNTGVCQLPWDSSGGNTAITVSRVDIRLFGTAGNGAHFMVNPTSCKPATAGLDVTSQGDTTTDFDSTDSSKASPVNASATVPFPVTGCNHADPNNQTPPFTPSVSMAPTETSQAGAPSGHDVKLHFNDSEADPIHQAHLKEAEVKLPAGVGLNAAAALDLDGCTDAQFGFGSDEPVRCPAASKIADVQVTTPILDIDPSTPALDPLRGHAYFGKPPGIGPPSDANPWKLFQVIEGAGLRIKLVGDVRIDASTGQVITTFKDDPATSQDESLPQTPFTDFKLTLRGGQDSILQNPRACSSPHQISAKLTPWSDDGSGAASVIKLESPGFNTTGCSTPEPFGPSVGASADPSQAGAHSKSHLEVTRPNGQQIIKKLHLSLPAGAVGSLAAVPLCPSTQIQAGSCSSDSQVGSVRVKVGPGNAALPVTGQLYLGEPVAGGDAASIGLVIPGKAGPIDLGNVVVVNRVKLRQSDGGIDVDADVPTTLHGIPLPIQRIDIDVDRPGFFQNPTGCDVRNLNASFEGDAGGAANASAPTQATGCDALDFKPKLRLVATGETKKSGHPGIRAIVTQASGQANISSTSVLLPQILRPDTVQINKPGVICKGDQLAANACPPQSLVGSAIAHSPLLSTPVAGPVYFVQDTGKILPRLAVQLRGAVSLDLSAGNAIQGVRTLNTFEGVPDVPVTRFELNVNGGGQGILKNFNDLCANPDHADATFTAHSGKSVTLKPELELEDAACKVSGQGRASVASRMARMSRKGIVAVKVKCAQGLACKGKLVLKSGKRRLGSKAFSIKAGASKKVKVKLKRKARRLVKKHRRRGLKAKAQIAGAGSAARTLTIRG